MDNMCTIHAMHTVAITPTIDTVGTMYTMTLKSQLSCTMHILTRLYYSSGDRYIPWSHFYDGHCIDGAYSLLFLDFYCIVYNGQIKVAL